MRWAAILLLSGCSIANKPDRGKIVPPDTAMDPSLEADGPDADAPDVPDADAGDAGDADTGPRVEDCDDGVDNDGDGIADCPDFDCASDPTCCSEGGGALVFDEDWSGGDLSAGWEALPSSVPSWPSSSTEDGFTGWSDETFPHAIRRRNCVPLTLGLRLDFEMQALRRGDCTSGMPCDRFASVVFTGADDMLEGQRLLNDFSVVMNASGLLEVTVGEDVVASHGFESERVEVSVRMTPGPGADGAPRLFATVRYDTDGPAAETTLVDRWPLLRQSDLLRDVVDCRSAPGLHLAIEGNGEDVAIGEVEARGAECANPSHFEVPLVNGETLRPDPEPGSGHLEPGTWGEGALGAPALIVTEQASGGPVRWDVFYEGTNVNPSDGFFGVVRYALGQSTSYDLWDEEHGWVTLTASPKAGDNPPTCFEGGGPVCPDDLQSLREPFVLADVSDEDVLEQLHAVYAMESATDPDVFGIGARSNIGNDPTVPFTPDALAILSPFASCASLRDPSMIPDGGSGYVLFFTCETEGAPASIWRAFLESDLRPLDGTEPEVFLSSDGLSGSYGALGVRGPEPILQLTTADEEATAVLSFWFVARDPSGADTIAFAQGVGIAADPAEAVATALTNLQEYPSNPVLTRESQVFEACDDCALTGVAVAEQDVTTLRFLVARRVQSDSELVPLEQTWR